MTFRVPERYRLKTGPFGSDERFGCNGAFFVPQRKGAPLKIIASDGMGWEHVSVSLPDRCPTWEEMARVKALFWDDDDCVLQYHPPRAEYVNNHAFCLHLWRPVGQPIPMPPSLLVGYKELSPDQLRGLTTDAAVGMMEMATQTLEGQAR